VQPALNIYIQAVSYPEAGLRLFGEVVDSGYEGEWSIPHNPVEDLEAVTKLEAGYWPVVYYKDHLTAEVWGIYEALVFPLP
jgi:hypothetical protein